MNRIAKIITCFILSLLSIFLIDNTKVVDAASNSDWVDVNTNLGEYAYSFAVIGDTQNLCRDYNEGGTPNLKYAKEFHGLYDWIIANKDTKKIKHVFGLGDITETHQWSIVDLEEWALAKEAISKMDGVIPYSLVRGNHDMSKYFNQTFNYPAYTNQFEGFFIEGDLCSSYKTMTIGSTNYLFITLNFGPSDEELEWASEIIKTHNDHKVIISTHGYSGITDPVNSTICKPLVEEMAYFNDIDYNLTRNYNNGEQIWEKLISKHGNIMLVLSGHAAAENVAKREVYGLHGNKVIELLIDPQWLDIDRNVGPVGMVCMLYFNEDGSKMNVEWYSTVKNKYYRSTNQYTVDLSESNLPAHDFYYLYDNTVHWQECDCEVFTEVEAHEWTINEDGIEACYCGATKQAPAKKDDGCGGSVVASIIGMFALLSITVYVKKKNNKIA